MVFVIGSCLLFVVCSVLLDVGWGLLCFVRCAVWWLLCVVCYALLVIRCVLLVVCLLAVCCLLFVV